MSENNNSFLYLEDHNSFQTFDPIEDNFIIKEKEESFEKCSKQDIFKITNYNFLKKKRVELKNKSHKKQHWTEEEDHKLSYIAKYKDLSWTQTSSFFSKRSPIQCQQRWTKVLQPNLKKGKWTLEEDKLLLNWVEHNGAQKWSKLSLILTGRSSKQIRDRWINNLNPDKIKYFNWSEELDRILLIKYLEHGSSWVTISKYISHTSENMIKNRFYSLLRSTASKRNKLLRIKTKKEEIEDKNSKIKNCQDFFLFDLSEATENKFTYTSSVSKYKKNNYSLSYLLNYLPNLLEEKGIKLHNNINSQVRVKDRIQNQNYNDYGINLLEPQDEGTTPENNFNEVENKSQILNKFFGNLSQKLYNEKESKIEEKTQFKFKSSIMLNLQLTLLHKIFNRLKLQVIQKFFECFKENTIPV